MTINSRAKDLNGVCILLMRSIDVISDGRYIGAEFVHNGVTGGENVID